MWFLSKKREPEYTEIGERIYQSLLREPLKWKDEISYSGGDHLINREMGIIIYTWGSMTSRVWFISNASSGEGGNKLYPEVITKDDCKRIGDEAVKTSNFLKLARKMANHRKSMGKVLGVKLSQFELDAIELAKLILANNLTAIRPLLDKCMEHAMENEIDWESK